MRSFKRTFVKKGEKSYAYTLGVAMRDITKTANINKAFRQGMKTEWFGFVKMIEQQNLHVIEQFRNASVFAGVLWTEGSLYMEEGREYMLPHPDKFLKDFMLKEVDFKDLTGISPESFAHQLYTPSMDMYPYSRFSNRWTLQMRRLEGMKASNINLERTMMGVLFTVFSPRCSICNCKCKAVIPSWGNGGGVRLCRACKRGAVVEVSTIVTR